MENIKNCYSGNQVVVASSSIISPAVESEQGFQEFSANIEIAPCPSCGSTQINVVKMPDYCHFAAIRCGHCDRFLRWQPKPQNIDLQQQRKATISHLLKSPHLSEWERTFLEGLKCRKISPKQRQVLDRIEAKVGGLN